MRFVVQRVAESEVKADGEILGKIGRGFMVLVGVCDSDTKEIADKMVKKMLGLRIFEDEQGKTNLSLESVGGELLLISQFTLYANCRKGTAPALSKQGRRIWHRICMNILSANVRSRCQSWKGAGLVRI